MDFSPIRHDDAAYSEYINLFSRCFPGSTKFSHEYLRWLYRLNPHGRAVGFDARENGRLTGHYACVPARAFVGSQEVNVLLSLNTATHPDYQGKGIFTQLAELTYETGSKLNYDCVYGVANSNSSPGFIKNLNFQLISPLRAMIGVGPLRLSFTEMHPLDFQRSWNADSLAWRCASPSNPLIVQAKQDCSIFLADALFKGYIKVFTPIHMGTDFFKFPTETKRSYSPLNLFIGLIPKRAKRASLYVDIPQEIRPSPLNLIYRSLTHRINAIDPDSVFLNFLDFDAY